MAINKFISIKEPILEAMKDMGIDISRDRTTFAMWALRAEKDIGSYYSYKRKRAVLTVKGCVAEMPDCAAYLKTVVLGDHGCDCDELISMLYAWAGSQVVSTTEVFVIMDQPDISTFSTSGVTWSIQNNCILFSKSLDGQKITIEYLGLEEDCDGFVMINENHKDAIIEFIMYKVAVRSRFSAVKMDANDIRLHRMEYDRLVADARARDSQLTDSERMEIVAMLHDPFSGWGLDVGITQNYW